MCLTSLLLPSSFLSCLHAHTNIPFQSRRGVTRPGSSLYGGGGDEEFDEAVLADEPGGVRAARKAAERQRSAAGACSFVGVCG